MNADTQNEAPQSVADAQATYWQRINAKLDERIAALSGSMLRHLRDDLSERLPRAQPLFYHNGTTYSMEAVKPSFAALEARLRTAVNGKPEKHDEQLFQRYRAPLYAAFVNTTYPENQQNVLAALKYQMGEAAGAFSAYTQRMMEDSFPRGQVPESMTSTRQLAEAVTQPMMRAYCCMQMLRPCADTGLGFTDNSMALMEAFDFMKEIAEADIRKQLEAAPKDTPKPVAQAHSATILPPAMQHTAENGNRARFTASQPLSEEAIRKLRLEAASKKTDGTPQR